MKNGRSSGLLKVVDLDAEYGGECRRYSCREIAISAFAVQQAALNYLINEGVIDEEVVAHYIEEYGQKIKSKLDITQPE